MPESMRIFRAGKATSLLSDVPAGVRISEIILIIFACGLGLCGVFFLIAWIILIYHGQVLWGVFSGLGVVVAVAVSLLCFRAAEALRRAQHWGANIATVYGGLAVAAGCLMIVDFFHIGKHSADEYFLYPIAIICLVSGIWLCVYLNIPRVRSGFEKHLD